MVKKADYEQPLNMTNDIKAEISSIKKNCFSC